MKPTLKQLGMHVGMSDAEASQLTNRGQIIAYKSGLSFSDSLTLTTQTQGLAIHSGVLLTDSSQFTLSIQIDAFVYLQSLTGAVYANSLSNAILFTTGIQLNAYKTGYVTVSQALQYTNNEQLLVLNTIRSHNLAIKKLPSPTTDSMDTDSQEWQIEINARKVELEHSSLSFDFYTDSAIVCQGAWGNTYNTRLDIAFKKDLAIIFPDCTPCAYRKASCLQCLDNIMRNVTGCEKELVSCDSSSFTNILTATSGSTTIADVVNNEICD